jgi:hypothetical protein
MADRSNPEGDEFRIFTGKQDWDYRALRDAYARLQQRRAALSAGSSDADSAEAIDVPDVPPETDRPLSAPVGVRAGSGRRAEHPAPARVLYVAGITAAAASVLAGITSLFVDSLGSGADGTTQGEATITAFAFQPTVTDTTSDPPSPTDAGTAGDDTSPTDQPTSPSAPTDPEEVIYAFYTAINSGDYQQAWGLGGDNLTQSYDTFVTGYDNTYHDDITAVDLNSTTVSVQLTATQDDGAVQRYYGTYTVIDGLITAADIKQAN